MTHAKLVLFASDASQIEAILSAGSFAEIERDLPAVVRDADPFVRDCYVEFDELFATRPSIVDVDSGDTIGYLDLDLDVETY